jgi:hypothetical protein
VVALCGRWFSISKGRHVSHTSSGAVSSPKPTERAALLAWIRGVSLVYGPWKPFKSLYKQVEGAFADGARDDEIFAALMARLDTAPFIEENSKKGEWTPAVRGYFEALHVTGDLLYAAQAGALVIFDLSSPLEPREIFRQELPASGARSWLEGSRLILGSAYGLHVFDLENPRAPRLTATLNPRSNSIDIVGDFLISAEPQKLRVLNLPKGDETALTEAGTIQTDMPYGYTLTAKAGLAAVLRYVRFGYQISFFDVSNPSSPAQISQINANNGGNWRFWGDILVRIDGDNLVFTDLSRPQNPREISRIQVQGAKRFHLAGNFAFVACQWWNRSSNASRLRIIDISQPHSPRLVGEFETFPRRMAAHGDLLFFSDQHGLKILTIDDPARPQPAGQRPSNKTFAYLKRRSRRFLRTLASADETAFATLSSAFLMETGNGRDSLDLKSQWTSAELIFGGGARWHQSSHGRGAYVKDAQKFVAKTREERAPGAWDAHLDTARALWNHPHLPWQTQEMALKILRAHGEPVSAPTDAQLTRFLWSESPALLNYAAREARKRLNDLDALALAPLLWIENAAGRREILAIVEQNSSLKTEIATHLATLLGQNAQTGLSRRGREIALLLAARFDLSDLNFGADGAFPALLALLGSAEAPLRALGLGFCRRLSAQFALEALRILPQIPAVNREVFIGALCESASRGAFDAPAIDKIVRHAEASVREAAWRLIEASATPNETLRAVWTKLFAGLRRESVYSGERYRSRYLGERWVEPAPLQSAINSPSALATLARCELSSQDVVPKWNAQLYLLPQNSISAALWGAYSLILPAPVVIEVVLGAPAWNESWRQSWIAANAPQPAKLAAFWNAVQAYLNSNNPENLKQILRERTFEQTDVAATFGGAASQLSPALLMSLIGAIPDHLWNQWRASLLHSLQSDAVTREAFWNAARQSSALDGGFLRARPADDAEFAATFGLLETDALEADNPAFAPLLLAWLRARENSLSREEWIEAAIHPLPEVRDFAIAQLEIIGLDVPGALRLLESRLVPSIALGRKWFENRGENELELALALADSPQLSVRAFGREFIAARLESLVENGLFAYLQDNPNAEMQAFIAAQLKDKPELAAPAFDRAVLRGRYRARHAKNLIQARRSTSAPLPDDRTLLEIARGRTPRDSDWA